MVPLVANAIASRVLNKENIHPELLDYLKPKIEFYEAEQDSI